jgi:glycyl-tRNA synthetase
MEVEYFVKPQDDEKPWLEWTEAQEQWLMSLGLPKKSLRRYDHPKSKLAHYSKGTTDIEYEFPFGWGEITGNARRTDFDLKNHQEKSGQSLEYFDEETKESYLPWVVEPTFGLDRIILATLVAAFHEEPDKNEVRTVLKLDPKVAPVKAAIFPLQKDSEIIRISQKIHQDLGKKWSVQIDLSGSIGRRYRRQDEIGTPYCITIDFDSIQDRMVTVRDRDSMKQERVKIDELDKFISESILNS